MSSLFAQSLSMRHDPQTNDRVLIETLGEWALYGPDHRTATYEQQFWHGHTSVQLIRDDAELGRISILMPARGTEGKFEYQVGNAEPVSVCCYTCVRNRLKKLGVSGLPEPSEWLIYMLMESVGFVHGPAPRELPVL